MGADGVHFGDNADTSLAVDDEFVGMGVMLVRDGLKELSGVVLPVLEAAEQRDEA